MTTKETALVFDGITGESIIVDLTPQEIEERKQLAQEALASQQEILSKVASRESALAKLAALGLTEEEIAAL